MAFLKGKVHPMWAASNAEITMFRFPIAIDTIFLLRDNQGFDEFHVPSCCCCSMNAWNAASNVSSATEKAGRPVISGDSVSRWLRCAARKESASSISYKATWHG